MVGWMELGSNAPMQCAGSLDHAPCQQIISAAAAQTRHVDRIICWSASRISLLLLFSCASLGIQEETESFFNSQGGTVYEYSFGWPHLIPSEWTLLLAATGAPNLICLPHRTRSSHPAHSHLFSILIVPTSTPRAP